MVVAEALTRPEEALVSSETARWAEMLHSLGANIVPIRRDEVGNLKRGPAIRWSQWQSQRQTAGEFAAVRDGVYGAVAAVGIISGVNDWRAIDVDAVKDDDSKPLERVSEAVLCAVLDGLKLPRNYPWVERSMSEAGWHIFVQCPDDLSELFSDPASRGVYVGKARDGSFNQIELRWARNQTVVAGTANPARWVNGVPSEAPSVVSAADVFQMASELAIFEPAKAPRTFKGGQEDNPNLPGGDFNIRGDLQDVLKRNQWQLVGTDGETELWRRPGKTEGQHSATFNHSRCPNRFYVFSSNAAPFEADTSYTPFAVYALLEHDGDYSEAARALRKADFGQPTGGGQPGTGNPLIDLELSSLGNARRLIHLFGNDFRFDSDLGKFRVWDGARWQAGREIRVQKMATDTLDAMAAAQWSITDTAQRSDFGKFHLKSSSERNIKEMMNLTHAEPGMTVYAEDLDTHGHLLNFPNGTLNLITEEFRSHNRADLITKVVSAPYDPDATATEWEKFIDAVFTVKGEKEPDRELINYVQKVFGYCLSGDMSEQAFFIAYGRGSNGKSTLINQIIDLLGDYGDHTGFSTFDADNKNAYGNDLAALRGVRFVAAIEADQNKAIGEARIKGITGGDPLKVRYLYQEFFKLAPEFKVFIAINQMPRIAGTDKGIWRRVRVIPFRNEFPTEPIVHKFEAERSGIFNWLIEGYRKWQDEGLGKLPAAVQEATGVYKTDNDLIQQWLEDTMRREDDEDANIDPPNSWEVQARPAYKSFHEWAESAGYLRGRIPTETAFGLAMAEKGFERKKCRKGNFYVGLAYQPHSWPDAEQRIQYSPRLRSQQGAGGVEGVEG